MPRTKLPASPKSHGPSHGRAVGPCTIVIFGASGDLTKRKLVPALAHLAAQGLLPREFAVVGFARSPLTHEQYRERMAADVKEMAEEIRPKTWSTLEPRLYYVSGDAGDEAAYGRLAKTLEEVEARHGTQGNVLFYLSTAPEFFGTIVQNLRASGLTHEEGDRWRRVIVEKPFGSDLASAKALNAKLRGYLDERQLYRIDHYLGKETVQNILVFRFGNGIFEPIWNRRYVDHVQITVAETLGVEKRGGYYDGSGALRDMVVNHIFQLISLTAMEPPISFDADAVRDEQSKILRAFTPIPPEDVLRRTVRGQYGAGHAGGKDLPDYRDEAGVSPGSNTETFAAMRLAIDNWRWSGVPFYLRVGKGMAARTTQIVIQFRKPPFVLFRGTSVGEIAPNTLTLKIQPDEGIELRFGAKVPGATLRLGPVTMDFNYADHFGHLPATGYERLLYDAMLGDATLFQRADMVEASWAAVATIQDVWRALPARDFPNYPAGSWGPKDSDDLLARDGRAWLTTAP